VFLSRGSILGYRRGYLDEALHRLGSDRAIRLVACSRIYETEPWPEHRVGRERWFLNCAVEIETDLGPRRLLARLHEIEAGAGRTRPALAPGEYADRTLDIDILLYGDAVVSHEDLQIPHPFLHERRFVLAPLCDIAPELEHPVLYQTIREILEQVADSRGIAPL
jgi:2-amino-4-hydroxy-6-hydroxymethyldihydropteridine diphosphokinase